jgi:hypothetical protein
MSTPAPVPGGDSTPGTPQGIFNYAYWRSKPPAFQPLYNGLAGAPNADIPALSAVDRVALIRQLAATGVDMDPLLDAGGLDPYAITYYRVLQGFNQIQSGTGLDASADVLPMGATGPLKPGYIAVSLTPPAPWPIPVPTPPAPPETPLAADPVGMRITPFSLNGLGDLFRCAVANDGYPTDGTGLWKGTTAQGFAGTFCKVAEEAGMMICWQMIAVGV